MTQDTSLRRTLTVLDAIAPEAFDALAAHPMQSYAWGEARKATGVRVARFGEYAGDQLVAVYQMTVHKLPQLPYCIGYVPRSAVPGREVVAFFREWARREKIVFIKWEPYVPEDVAIGLAALPGMRVSPHPLFTEWNQEIDLARDEATIFAGFKKNVRYSIRHAETAGVSVREMSTPEGFEIFADLYFGTARRQAYHGHTRAYHRILWNALSQVGIARLFVAFYDGKPHAAFEIFVFRGRAYYPYSGSSDADRHIPSTQLLMWEVIRAAKREGCTALDLWGSLPERHDKQHPWAGFTFFKQGFGGRFVHMAKSHDLVVMPLLYKLYSAAYAVRRRAWGAGGL